MARPKKENGDRKYIIIQIYYEDYKKLVKNSTKDENFADIVHKLIKNATKIKQNN